MVANGGTEGSNCVAAPVRTVRPEVVGSAAPTTRGRRSTDAVKNISPEGPRRMSGVYRLMSTDHGAARSGGRRTAMSPARRRSAHRCRLLALVVGCELLEVAGSVLDRDPPRDRRPERHTSCSPAVAMSPEILQLLDIVRPNNLRLERPMLGRNEVDFLPVVELERFARIRLEGGHGGLEDQAEPAVRIAECAPHRRDALVRLEQATMDESAHPIPIGER